MSNDGIAYCDKCGVNIPSGKERAVGNRRLCPECAVTALRPEPVTPSLWQRSWSAMRLLRVALVIALAILLFRYFFTPLSAGRSTDTLEAELAKAWWGSAAVYCLELIVLVTIPIEIVALRKAIVRRLQETRNP